MDCTVGFLQDAPDARVGQHAPGLFGVGCTSFRAGEGDVDGVICIGDRGKAVASGGPRNPEGQDGAARACVDRSFGKARDDGV